MFKRMVLKRVLGEVQRFENTTKKRSIRLSAKITYWPFRDIYKTRVAEHFVNYEQIIQTSLSRNIYNYSYGFNTNYY
jgi:hypothetical protein